MVLRVAKRDMSNLADGSPTTEVITGGTGGLGMLIARWLSGRGATNLVLASRSGRLGAAAPNERTLLLASRTHVEVASCDAGEASGNTCLVACASTLGALTGVWHAAGVLSDGLLAKHNAVTLSHVYSPKVHGAFLLQRASLTAPLGRWLAFSSVVALMGNAGQSNYSAANCCLDAQAAYRRKAGLVGAAAQWGPWSEVGMASGAKIGKHFEASGLLLISLAHGLRAVQAAVQLDRPPVVGCVPADWAKIVRNDTVVPAFLSAVAKKAKAEEGVGGGRMGGRAKSRAVADAAQGCTIITVDAVRQMVSRTVGNDCDLDVPLVEVGLDSLGAVELSNLLQASLGKGVGMPTTLVFDHPTTRTIFAFVEKTQQALIQQQGPSAAVAPSADAEVADPADAVDKAPSPIALVQLLQLPGLDGSFFQFRALEAVCLTNTHPASPTRPPRPAQPTRPPTEAREPRACAAARHATHAISLLRFLLLAATCAGL